MSFEGKILGIIVKSNWGFQLRLKNVLVNFCIAQATLQKNEKSKRGDFEWVTKVGSSYGPLAYFFDIFISGKNVANGLYYNN